MALAFAFAPSAASAPVSAPRAVYSTQPRVNVASGSSAPSTRTLLSVSAAAGVVGAASMTRQKQAKRGARACRAAALDASKELGAMAPCGYWDPCGLMKERVGAEGWQWRDEKTFEKYRVAELKHGRVAMLAATGLLTNVVWKFQGFDLVPQGVSALQTEQGGAGFGIIFILAAYFELNNWKGEFPDPLNLGKAMNENMNDLRTKELNNGRVGMVAAITLLMYDVCEGKLPSEMVYHTNLNLGTVPAVLALAFVVPLFSQVSSYDATPAEIKAKREAKKLPEAVPVTIKAELPKDVKSEETASAVEKEVVKAEAK